MGKRRHHGGGPSPRQLKVAETIRRSLAEILARGDVHDPELMDLSVTVGEVRTSPDLRVAWVSILPLGGGDAEAAVAALSRHRGELRRRLDRKLHLKYSPELRFEVDPLFDQMDAARRMFADERVRRDVAGGDGDDTGSGPAGA